MAAVNDSDFHRAARSVKRFNSAFAPTLTTVARAATGQRRLRVMAGETSCTDSRVIWLRPAIELGDNIPHDRHLCSKRDDKTSVMLCPACKRDDLVLATAFHEMAHIIYESFGTTDDKRLEAFKERAVKAGNSASLVAQAADAGGHVAVSKLLDPHLPWAFNVFEDSRVNAAMRAERPGFGRMRQAMMHTIVVEGIDGPNGEKLMWSQNAPHLQAGIAAMAMADKTDPVWRPALDPDATDIVFDDEVVQKLALEVDDADDSWDILDLAEKLVNRFRELEILPDADDDPGEGEPCDDGEAGDSGDSGDSDSGDSSGDGGAGESGQSEPQDGRGSDAPDDSDVDDADADSGADNGAGDESDDDDDGGQSGGGQSDEEVAEEMEKGLGTANGHPDGQPESSDFEPGQGGVGGGAAPTCDDEYENEVFAVAIQQGDWFNEPSMNVLAPAFRDIDDNGSAGRFYSMSTSRQQQASEQNGVLEIVPGVVGPGVSRLRKVFDANKSGGYADNLRRGRVSRRGMARKFVNDDPRMFRKKLEVSERSYHVVVMMDMSGSTRDDCFYRAQQWAGRRGEAFDPNDVFKYPNGSNMLVFDAMKHLAVHLGDMFDRLDISFELYGHTCGLETKVIGNDYLTSFDLFRVKGPNDVWSSEQRHRLASLQGAAGNLDGHAMEFGRKQAEKADVTDRIVIYMSDGEMPAANGPEETEILERECAYMRKSAGIHCLGIGIHCDSPREFGLDTVVVNTAHDLQAVFTRMEGLLS